MNRAATGLKYSNEKPEKCIEPPVKPVINTAAQVGSRLGKGPHPGFKELKSQVGVYLCCLRPERDKKKPEHADYRGMLELTGSRCLILVWVHQDGTLGLRLSKVVAKKS
jgi:hypothetical protein